MPDGNTFLAATAYRAATVRAETANEKSRTVELIFTTGAAVRRRRGFAGDEIDEELIVTPAAVRLERLNAGAPFLNSHNSFDLADVMGVVESARIEAGAGVATVRLSERAEVEPIWRDIKAGIIRNVSVGYRVHAYEIEKRDGLPELWRAVDWEPLELSAVAIGADAGAQFRAADTGELYPFTKTYKSTGKVILMPESITNPSADEIRKTERERVAFIHDLVRRFALPAAFGQNLIDKNATRAEAGEAILNEAARRDNLSAGPSEISEAAIYGRHDGANAIALAILARLSPRYRDEAAASPDARAYSKLSMTEMVRQNLQANGIPANHSRGELADIATRGYAGYGAQNAGDFGAALENAARRFLQDAYKAAEPGARLLAREIQFNDFRPVRSIAGSGFPELLEVPEGAEIKNGVLTASGNEMTAATYARIAGLTRQAIINDDIGLFADALRLASEAALATEQKLITAKIEQNPVLLDGDPIFHTNHGNLASSGAAIGETSLSAAVKALRDQTKTGGERIALSPRFLLVPTAIETAARKAVAAVNPQSTANANIFAGLEVIVEPRLTSATAWYLVAGEGATPAIGLARGYIGGVGPEVFTEQGFRVDALEIKVRMDFGCGWQDHRGWFKNPGA